MLRGSGRAAGDYGFDPLGFSTDPKKFEELQMKELANGTPPSHPITTQSPNPHEGARQRYATRARPPADAPGIEPRDGLARFEMAWHASRWLGTLTTFGLSSLFWPLKSFLGSIPQSQAASRCSPSAASSRRRCSRATRSPICTRRDAALLPGAAHCAGLVRARTRGYRRGGGGS